MAIPIQTAVDLFGGLSKLARKLGVKPPAVSQWIKGIRPVPPRRCTQIEAATNGAVTRQDLRPDDWQEIWPELAASTTPKPPLDS